MKKQSKKVKILKLNQETLRRLDDKDYLKIAGGGGSQNFGGGPQCAPSAPTDCMC
jgi:hypothetical protein